MEDTKLTPRQEKFVKLANDEGFTNKITRKDITILQAKYGIKKPAWLMKIQPIDMIELCINCRLYCR